MYRFVLWDTNEVFILSLLDKWTKYAKEFKTFLSVIHIQIGKLRPDYMLCCASSVCCYSLML